MINPNMAGRQEHMYKRTGVEFGTSNSSSGVESSVLIPWPLPYTRNGITDYIKLARIVNEPCGALSTLVNVFSNSRAS